MVGRVHRQRPRDQLGAGHPRAERPQRSQQGPVRDRSPVDHLVTLQAADLPAEREHHRQVRLLPRGQVPRDPWLAWRPRQPLHPLRPIRPVPIRVELQQRGRPLLPGPGAQGLLQTRWAAVDRAEREHPAALAFFPAPFGLVPLPRATQVRGRRRAVHGRGRRHGHQQPGQLEHDRDDHAAHRDNRQPDVAGLVPPPPEQRPAGGLPTNEPRHHRRHRTRRGRGGGGHR